LAVVGHRQRHPGVESLGHGLPTRTALIAGHDAAGEEFADAARTVAEEPDALAREILIVVEQGAQTGVERSRVRIAEATVVQVARGQPRIPRALGTCIRALRARTGTAPALAAAEASPATMSVFSSVPVSSARWAWAFFAIFVNGWW